MNSASRWPWPTVVETVGISSRAREEEAKDKRERAERARKKAAERRGDRRLDERDKHVRKVAAAEKQRRTHGYLKRTAALTGISIGNLRKILPG